MRSRTGKPVPYHATHSWTDDLPICKQSGVGSATNQIYREDQSREEEHAFEDKSFHCKVDDSTFFYGVFDGHNGSKTSTFALQRMAAEILLGQLSGKSTDEEIKDVLRQAFVSVEKGYLDSIDDLLAERTSLLYEIADGSASYETYQKNPEAMERLDVINYELSSGTSAVIALIHCGKLYVANVGNSRALLCKTDANSVLRVVQLSIDHDLRNEDEMLRLSQLGVNIDELKKGTVVGNQENTRCLGNFMVKGGYREFEELSSALSEPVIAEPEIHGGIILDESCRFLLLMSDGLYQSLEEATPSDQVNKDIAQLVVTQFRVQSTLTGVAQAVVDKTVRIHHDFNMSTCSCSKRDDIILLIRNFNFPMPNAIHSPTNPTVRFNPIIQTKNDNTLTYNHSDSDSSYSVQSPISSQNSTYRTNTRTNTDTSPSSDINQNTDSSLTLDSNRRIAAYVDFSDYYRNIEIAKQNGTLPEGLDFD